MGVWRPGAFMDLDEEPCGLWSRLARYGACNCRSGVPPPDSAAGMVPPYWAARCAAGEFAGGHEPPGDRPALFGGGGVAASLRGLAGTPGGVLFPANLWAGRVASGRALARLARSREREARGGETGAVRAIAPP